MQRLFSTFADGWPGGGILLLRLLMGVGLILRSVSSLETPNAPGGPILFQIAGAVAGLFILGGLWTPVVGIAAALLEAWIAFTQPAAQAPAIALAALALSLAMIGPGAWSIDARLYGRKQILPPDS